VPGTTTPARFYCYRTITASHTPAPPKKVTFHEFDSPFKISPHYSPLFTSFIFGSQKILFAASISRLDFGFHFNQPLFSLPPSPIPSVSPSLHLALPLSLTHLTTGCCFDQSLELVSLPPSLTHLSFGSPCSYPLSSLPPSLSPIFLHQCFALLQRTGHCQSPFFSLPPHACVHFQSPASIPPLFSHTSHHRIQL
jgi:hypothetical protein